MTTYEPQASLALQLPVMLRTATQDDLPKLEWYGQYKHFRKVFRRTFQDQESGRRLMLLADFNDFPIGQLFVSFRGPTRAYFYSFRVMEMFRGQGIGTWLLQEAEEIVTQRGVERVTIAAARTNLRARQLYERLGYRIRRSDSGRWRYVDHRGRVCEVHEPSWILEKNLIPR